MFDRTFDDFASFSIGDVFVTVNGCLLLFFFLLWCRIVTAEKTKDSYKENTDEYFIHNEAKIGVEYENTKSEEDGVGRIGIYLQSEQKRSERTFIFLLYPIQFLFLILSDI